MKELLKRWLPWIPSQGAHTESDAIVRAKALTDDAFRAHPERYKVNMNEAERILRRALEAKPGDKVLLTCLGTVLSDNGKFAEAIEVLKAALAAGSKDRNTYFNLGAALMSTEGRDAAMRYFNKARSREASPLTWEAYFDPHGH